MPDEETGQQVADQAGASAEGDTGAQAGEAEGGAGSAVGESQGGQAEGKSAPAQGEQEDFGPKDLPEELKPLKQELLKAFYAKTRGLAEERKELGSAKEKAEMFQQLWNYKPFQDWWSKEQTRTSGAGNSAEDADLTAEKLQEISADPNKFLRLLDERVERAMSRKVNPALIKTQEQLENMAFDKEAEELAAKYPDFDEINEAGLLDEFVTGDRNYKQAYAMYKLEHPGNVDAAIAKRAAEMVNKSKLGFTEKPSGVPHPGPTIRKVKGFDEAFDALWEAKMKGQTIKLEKA